jgi:4-amino-4-deoxy-L-arabinose transferase-like glycosyltransferase
MTKELTDEERLTLSRSLIAVVENNEEELLALAKEAGLKSKYNRPATLIFFVKFAWGAYASGDEAEAAYKADPIIQSAGGLTLVRRVVFMLRGLCQVLGCPVDLVRTWEPVARKALQLARKPVHPA